MTTVAPTLHMNGTLFEHFRKHLTEAAEHLLRAQESLKQVAPHRRDYYVKEGGGEPEFAAAQAAHEWRLTRIEQALRSVEGLHIALVNQTEG